MDNTPTIDDIGRPQAHVRPSSYASSSSAGPSLSRSAPVSPSASFASLAALRHSLAMRSGDLGLEESAHTFPVDDGDLDARDQPSDGTRSNSNTTAAQPSSPSRDQSQLHRTRLHKGTRGPLSNGRSGRMYPSSSSGPIPPPLSMQNLPPPRMTLSAHHDRRISPFQERRGMSFTPAASPPLNLSPTLPLGTCDPDATTSRRRMSATTSTSHPPSTNISRSSSPNGSATSSSGRTEQSRRSNHSRRTRARATSDASVQTSSMGRRCSRTGNVLGEGTNVVAPMTPAHAIAIPGSLQSYHHRSSSAIGPMAGFPESDASDTGAEGDADDVPPRPLRTRPSRSRSNSHLSSNNPLERFTPIHRTEEGLPPSAGRRLGSATTGGGSSPRSSWYGTSPANLFSGRSSTPAEPSSYFQPSSGTIEDLSAAASQLWQLHQATLGFSAAAGLGVDMNITTSASPSLVTETMIPPPPYQANDDVDHVQLARNLVNQLEREQAEASQGRRLQQSGDDLSGSWQSPGPDHEGDSGSQAEDGLSFRSGRHRSRDERRFSRVESNAAHLVSDATPTISALDGSQQIPQSANDDYMTTGVGVDQSPSPDQEGDPPAWQPKSDTEGDTDTNEVEPVRVREIFVDGITSSREPERLPRSQTTISGPRTQTSRRGINERIATSPLARRIVEEEDYFGPSPWVLRYLLHPLRLLAAVPGCLGTFWLLRNATVQFQTTHSLFIRGPLDMEQPLVSNPWRMTRSLDFLLASLWAVSTAYHALSLTTLLLRRWLIYYSLLPSLIRLLALQAICWPLVRMTIFIAGPDRPIEAWIVIASTTAFSDVVARWVTSNIADAPTKRVVQKRRGQSTTNGGPTRARSRSSAGGGTTPTPTSLAGSRSSSREREVQAQQTTAHHQRQPRRRRAHTGTSFSSNGGGGGGGRGGERVRAGQRFWRAVMGAPIDSSTSDSDNSSKSGDESEDGHDMRAIRASAVEYTNRRSLTSLLLQRFKPNRTTRPPSSVEHGTNPHIGGGGVSRFNTDTDAELDGETTDAGATTTALLDEDEEEDGETAEEALHRLRVALRRRRRHRMRLKMVALEQTGISSSSNNYNDNNNYNVSSLSSHISSGGAALGSGTSWSGNRGLEATSSDGAKLGGGMGVKVRSRRVFHWEVAMKRNVAPIGILAYLTLWGLLIGT